MFNATQLVIDTYVETLQENYRRIYGLLEPEFPNVIGFVGRMALENIANSDAAYHDVHHTICVTDVGQEILRGKHLSEGGVSPRDWLHFVISLLCHDIGYVRGVCRGDREGHYVIDDKGNTVTPPPGATDAYMTPYHVNRSKIFIHERFGHVPFLDVGSIESNIEHTRFPVPEGDSTETAVDYPGLLRAADLIGQMADINYLKKGSSLFNEFRETGINEKLGYQNPADLREAYPGFFWHVVRPLIGDALHYLRITQEGKLWTANLFAHVFAEEHNIQSMGAERDHNKHDAQNQE